MPSVAPSLLGRAFERILVIIVAYLNQLRRIDALRIEVARIRLHEIRTDGVGYFYLLLAVGRRDKDSPGYEKRDDSTDERDDYDERDVFLFHHCTSVVVILKTLAGW